MKPETAFILAATAAAAALVFWPRKALVLPEGEFDRRMTPTVGKGDASTIWTDAASAAYRAQLQREMAGAGWDQL